MNPLNQLAVPKKARKCLHPLRALFACLRVTPEHGMALLTDGSGILSDLWERYPEPEEITWGEVIACFEAAKTRLNPAWCDREISSIKSKILA